MIQLDIKEYKELRQERFKETINSVRIAHTIIVLILLTMFGACKSLQPLPAVLNSIVVGLLSNTPTSLIFIGLSLANRKEYKASTLWNYVSLSFVSNVAIMIIIGIYTKTIQFIGFSIGLSFILPAIYFAKRRAIKQASILEAIFTSLILTNVSVHI